jgi:hypothetical protein
MNGVEAAAGTAFCLFRIAITNEVAANGGLFRFSDHGFHVGLWHIATFQTLVPNGRCY